MLIVGIDVGKRNHEAAIIDEKGAIKGGKSFRFANSHEGIALLLGHINKHNPNKEEIVFGLEATGHYWLSLYDHLSQEGFKLHVINPIQTDSLRNFNIRSTKTDSVDSQLIANAVRMGNFPQTRLAEDDLLELKELGRLRLSHSSMVGDIKRRVISTLDRVFPEYETLFTDIFGATSIQLLSEYPTPEALASLETEKLAGIIASLSRGRFGMEKAQEIQSKAQNTFGNRFAQQALVLQIKQLLEQIKLVEEQMAELDAIIAQKVSTISPVATTIPGFGPVLGAVLVGEIGDIRRFDSAAKLVAFAGIDPSLRQSGEFEGSKIHMSKRGSPHLRRAIWMAAMNASKNDPTLKEYYQKKRAEGKHHMRALGAVCRKLCHIIFAVMRDNKPYQLTVQTPND